MAQNTKNITDAINEAVETYFESNPEVNSFAAKKLMPGLVEKGVFQRDIKNGMPLRKVLRGLDSKGELDSIERVYVERIGQNIYWYFVREGAEFVSNHVSNTPNAKEKRALERSNNDEVYIMELIDDLLKAKGSRKHTFDYLLGDLHKNGKTRTELPIDLYYEKLNLAIEIVEHPEKN
ncbi:MAG: hypothetical protein MK066_09305, partial [Crocinitomicaceae bacterium]|nr:hypothetical protein [Crocinitomicaceae bacterium]